MSNFLDLSFDIIYNIFMDDLSLAIKTLECDGELTCVLRKEKSEYTSKKRGITPLVEFIDDENDYCGYSAADRIVGRTAALLYVLLGVKEVYAEVMERAATEVFEKHGVKCRHKELAEMIINRSGTGPCPMEIATRGVDDPKKALCLVKQKLEELKRAK